MKGMVLTEFVDFAEESLPPAAAAAVRARLAALRPGGYSPVGTYAHGELTELAEVAAASSDATRDAVLERYGARLFARFAVLYPTFLVDADGALAFLERIDTAVHPEVKKLHPDARFPAFECRRAGPDRLEMVYRSERPLAALAAGLIRGCIEYFGDPIDLRREDLDAAGGAARFVLTCSAARSRRRPASVARSAGPSA